MDSISSGNTLLSGVSNTLGVPLDHINFVTSQLIALALAPLLQNVLHPKVAKPAYRQAFVLIIGILLGYFAFGNQIIHLAGLPTLCYIFMKLTDPKIAQRYVFITALGYLSCIHFYRLMYSSGIYALDVTGPLMVMTQKITSLGFNLHDGLVKKEEDLKPNQKNYAIKTMPTLLEYFSFVFHFPTLMAGPMIFFTDYMAFITGQNLMRRKTSSDENVSDEDMFIEPKPYLPVMKKISGSIFCAIMFSVVVFPIEHAKDEEFLKRGIVYQMLYLTIATTLSRFKYYHAWLLADAINNVAGLGFNGFTSEGDQKWNLISNVDMLGFEFGLSLRDCIQSWNIQTNKWLRMVVYERVEKNGVILTFALSAIWHGFYPGYYLTFASGALFTQASRSVRKYIRPHFMTSPSMKLTYDILTCVSTRAAVSYMTFSFVLLEFWVCVRIWWNMYCWLHILGLFVIYGLPKFLGQNEAQLRNRLTKLVASSNGVNSLHG